MGIFEKNNKNLKKNLNRKARIGRYTKSGKTLYYSIWALVSHKMC